MISNIFRRYAARLALMLIISFFSPAEAAAPEWLKYFTFSEKGVLRIWKEKLLKTKVDYKVINEPETGDYVRAIANVAASGIYYEIKYNPKERPYLSWKWKVDQFPKKSANEDDFAARIYVIFPANIFIMSRCIEYVWDSKLPEGTVTKSPLSGRIKVIVLRSGKKEGWVQEERNVFQDYLKVYNEEPEDFDDKVGAVAFMTDTDDTKSRSQVAFDEFKIGYKKPQFRSPATK